VKVLRSAAVFLLGTFLLVGLVPESAPSASAQVAEPLTRLQVTKITPSLVGGAAPDELTMDGLLTNTSDHPISNLEAVVQRGSPADSEASAQEAVQGNATALTQPIFKPLAGLLQPGQQVPIEIRIPIRGGQNSLQISRSGVYPLMVNVNGEPGPGGRARRVSEARFLLPVLSPPGAPPERPPEPTPTTLLVPIVDNPRMEQEATASPAVLTDDQLAASLAPGGRLYGLVQAIEDGTAAGSPLGNSLCFAIDPDLLQTVSAMQRGYKVRQRDGSLQDGTGAQAATLWLSKLKAVTKGRCVIALPYSDADVVALGRAGLPDLIKGALDGAAVVQQTLDVAPRTDVFWPIDGALDQPAESDLAALGIRTMLMQPSDLTIPKGSLGPVRLRSADPATAPTAQPIDPLVSGALDPLNDPTGKTTTLSPPENGSLSAQNALGALVFRSITGFKSGATSVLAPPRRWNLGGDDLRGMLAGMQQLASAGYLKPTGLPPSPGNAGADSGPQPPPATNAPPEANLAYPVAAGPNEIPQPLLSELARQNYKVGALFRSSIKDTAANFEPSALTTPLRDGLLRSVSSAWRGNPAQARDWLGKAENVLAGTLSGVGIEEWGGTITLTSANASIPLTVTNRLPVTIEIVLRVPQQLGIETKDLGVLRIPPQNRRQFFLQTTVRRAGQFSVDVSAVTADGGTELGTTKRLRLEYFAYSGLTIPLTLIAAALLVVLSIRRIVRRMRAARVKRTDTPVPEDPAEVTDPTTDAFTAETATTERDHNRS
jgi:hypothetical protein